MRAHKYKNEKGFAVLTSAVLLSLAGIAFTANMASIQLVDNQIIGNYYRNNEAFVNAESGMNYVLSHLDDATLAKDLLDGLSTDPTSPTVFTSTDHHYTVNVYKNHSTKLTIRSLGTSMDGTASRNIQLQIDFNLDLPIPAAAVLNNGKANFDNTALISDGCEGLSDADCLSSGNLAKKLLISNPSNAAGINDPLCSVESTVNEIDPSAHYSTGGVVIDNEGHWTAAPFPEGTKLFGDLSTDPNIEPSSLFEATFGIEMTASNLQAIKDNAAEIDMTAGGDCSDKLQDVSDEDDIVFITGDCDISQYYAQKSKSSENKVFTIGSVGHPKLVFIQGGTFINAPNTGTTIVGMLYFLPGTHDKVGADGNVVYDAGGNPVQEEDLSIDMAGINVNGAVLSEYKCSYDGYDKTDNNGTKQHFSARFDKLVLGELYSKMGVGAIGSSYQLSAGTWRDF